MLTAHRVSGAGVEMKDRKKKRRDAFFLQCALSINLSTKMKGTVLTSGSQVKI